MKTINLMVVLEDMSGDHHSSRWAPSTSWPVPPVGVPMWHCHPYCRAMIYFWCQVSAISALIS